MAFTFDKKKKARFKAKTTEQSKKDTAQDATNKDRAEHKEIDKKFPKGTAKVSHAQEQKLKTDGTIKGTKYQYRSKSTHQQKGGISVNKYKTDGTIKGTKTQTVDKLHGGRTVRITESDPKIEGRQNIKYESKEAKRLRLIKERKWEAKLKKEITAKKDKILKDTSGDEMDKAFKKAADKG